MLRTPSQLILGATGKKPEIILSSEFSKKVITIDVTFPGYQYFCAPGYGSSVTPAAYQGIIPANTLYYRVSDSHATVATRGLYRPVMAIGSADAEATPTTITIDAAADLYKLGVGTETGVANELIRVWDNDGAMVGVDAIANLGRFANGANDLIRYVASWTIGTPSVTLNGALALTIDANDVLFVGYGVEDIGEWVIVEDEVNLRTDNKPAAFTSNLTASAIYRGRVNSAMITQFQWGVANWPVTLQRAVKHFSQALIFDNILV